MKLSFIPASDCLARLSCAMDCTGTKRCAAKCKRSKQWRGSRTETSATTKEIAKSPTAKPKRPTKCQLSIVDSFLPFKIFFSDVLFFPFCDNAVAKSRKQNFAQKLGKSPGSRADKNLRPCPAEKEF